MIFSILSAKISYIFSLNFKIRHSDPLPLNFSYLIVCFFGFSAYHCYSVLNEKNSLIILLFYSLLVAGFLFCPNLQTMFLRSILPELVFANTSLQLSSSLICPYLLIQIFLQVMFFVVDFTRAFSFLNESIMPIMFARFFTFRNFFDYILSNSAFTSRIYRFLGQNLLKGARRVWPELLCATELF